MLLSNTACQRLARTLLELGGRNESGHVKYAEQSISDTIVRGVTPSMVPILDIDLTSGRMLNDLDVKNDSAVAVVGPDISDNLMPGADPLDKEIRIDGWVYRVIGVGKRKGKTLGYRFGPLGRVIRLAHQRTHLRQSRVQRARLR